MENVIAYWLLPAEPARTFFAGTIRDLARRFNAPVFDPHLTVFIAPENSRAAGEVLSKVGQVAVDLRAINISVSEQFTKTLFVRFEKTDTLQELSDSICEASGAAQRDVVDPHVSLLYHDLPIQNKHELAESIVLRFREVMFKSVCAMLCPSPTLTGDDVRAWRLLAAQNSNTR